MQVLPGKDAFLWGDVFRACCEFAMPLRTFDERLSYHARFEGKKPQNVLKRYMQRCQVANSEELQEPMHFM